MIGALSLNALIFMPRTADLAEQHAAPEQGPDFILVPRRGGDWPIRTPGAPPVAEQFDALERPLEEARTAPAGWTWAGAYGSGVCGGTVLRLGTRSYSLFEQHAFGQIALYEYGTFHREGELLRFESQASSGDRSPLESLIRVELPNSSWLAEPGELPAVFCSREQDERGFQRLLGTAFVRDRTPSDPEVSIHVPEAYHVERERLGRVRLVELLPLAQGMGPRLARFEQVSGVPIQPFDRLWWDGECCTPVYARVREVGPTGLLATLDLPQAREVEELPLGSTFSRLPRLE